MEAEDFVFEDSEHDKERGRVYNNGIWDQEQSIKTIHQKLVSLDDTVKRIAKMVPH